MKTIPFFRNDAAAVRCKVELQGFRGLSDQEIRALRPWLKLAPAVCLLWVIAGGALQAPLVMAALIPFALGGAILPWHPFDALYQWVLRRWTGGPAIPRYQAPRRFACVVATVWLTATTGAFLAGATWLGCVLGSLFVVTAAMPVLFDFCVPSFLFQKLRGWAGGLFGQFDGADDRQLQLPLDL